MAIKKSDYNFIKSMIHTSVVPMCVKTLWLKDKQFNKWFNNSIKSDYAKMHYEKIK